MYNYVVTAHKHSGVSHTAVGNFLSPDHRNLLVAKVHYIQVYNITPEGLVCAVELPIFGTISVMKLIRMPHDTQHHLVILTEKEKLCILRWNLEENRCHVVSTGNMHDEYAVTEAQEKIGIVDPNGRCIALCLRQNLLKIIPTSGDADRTAFNVRMRESSVMDMVFLHGRPHPTIAVIFGRDKVNAIRTYEISIHDQDICLCEPEKTNLDLSYVKMVAVPQPYGGVLVFGDDAIIYLSPEGDEVKQPIDATIINAVGQIDDEGTRYLVGDHKGQLMMLMLVEGPSRAAVLQLKVDVLGETSAARSISYLDSGFVYIGSRSGDSQLIRLGRPGNSEMGSLVDVVQSYTHLGPVVDFCIVKGMGYLRQGQGQVVTCSGLAKDGSLRIIRNGIGISEQASVELPGIKDMYSLRRHFGDRYHSYLLQSFTSATRVLELIGAHEMAPASLPGFDESSPTLHAANMLGDILVQVTANGVHVTDCQTMTPQPALAWLPPTDVRVSIASGNATQLLLATTGGNLIYLAVDVEKKTVVEVSHVKMENEIACVNCNYLKVSSKMTDVAEKKEDQQMAFVGAVGLWAEVNECPVVKLVALPSLATIHTVELGGDVIARCVLLCSMEGRHYLLVALGDGCLLTYSVNAETAAAAAASGDPDVQSTMNTPSVVSERRKLSVGTQPADLSIFKSRGSDHVFAACDRPTVVYAATGGGKLLISNVNLQEVTRVCGFDTAAFPDCLAIATEDCLHLGAVDEIQKLHISTVPLHEQPRRIAHMESARVFAVLTESTHIDENGDETLEQFVRTIDDTRYDTIDKYRLKPMEIGSAILATTFKNDNINPDEQFLVVGTGFEKPEQEDADEGRILIFRLLDGKPVLVSELQTKGPTHCFCSFDGMFLAGTGPEVRLFSVSAGKDGVITTKIEDKHHGHILGLQLARRGDFILVGDLIKSIMVLTCKKVGETYQLEEVARDYGATMVMALEMLDDDVYVVAEHGKHLLTYQRNSYAATDAERGRLERIGQFHLGSRVNSIQHGSLVMQMTDNEGPATKTLIFGTPDGTLGVIACIKPAIYEFFLALQNAMATLIPGVGGLSHADWRAMTQETPPSTAPAKNFVDGDLIERFLDLSMAQMSKVSSMVSVPVDELVQKVEEMQRLHGAG